MFLGSDCIEFPDPNTKGLDNILKHEKYEFYNILLLIRNLLDRFEFHVLVYGRFTFYYTKQIMTLIITYIIIKGLIMVIDMY